MKTLNVKKRCANYRERISECRNCQGTDALYKECYRQKYIERFH